jgi:hypothetical protein
MFSTAKFRSSVSPLCLASCISLIAAATTCDSIAQGSGTTSVPNDTSNYLSDVISFSVPVEITPSTLASADEAKKSYAAPGTRFRVHGVGKVSKTDGFLLVEVLNAKCIFTVPEAAAKQCSDQEKVAGEAITPSSYFWLSAGTGNLVNLMRSRVGWAYGAMIAPYKYQLTGNRQIAGGASVGGWLGRRQLGYTGTEDTGGFFLGAGEIPVAKLVDGKATTDNQFGVSYGFFYSTRIKREFLIAILLGVDRVNRSAEYTYNGKPWLAITFGVELGN